MALLTRKDTLSALVGQGKLRHKLDENNPGTRGDSRTILQSMEAGAAPFSERFDKRVGETYGCLKDMPGSIDISWGWVESKNNGADIAK